jgi:hypothetical protein
MTAAAQVMGAVALYHKNLIDGSPEEAERRGAAPGTRGQGGEPRVTATRVGRLLPS